jgi:hypothetical protein
MNTRSKPSKPVTKRRDLKLRHEPTRPDCGRRQSRRHRLTFPTVFKFILARDATRAG